MIKGNRNKINLTTDNFSKFIENDWLYVDKTEFIEHIFNDGNEILLFTRPRRMGKSLNMNTLHTFADIKNDSAHLFKGLNISQSRVFENINKYCVMYLDFKNYGASDFENFKMSLKMNMQNILYRYLSEAQINPTVKKYLDDSGN